MWVKEQVVDGPETTTLLYRINDIRAEITECNALIGVCDNYITQVDYAVGSSTTGMDVRLSDVLRKCKDSLQQAVSALDNTLNASHSIENPVMKWIDVWYPDPEPIE
jgi:hypothetical protein